MVQGLLKKLQSRLAVCARDFLRDEEGQATIEYILLLSITVIGAGLISRTVLNSIDRGLLKLGSQLEKDLKTGRAKVNVWRN
jgi:Flp pilus assembly pilin Flp